MQTGLSPHDGDPRTFRIIGAAMTVHRLLGRGFLESVYRDALAVELELCGIGYEREVPCNISYKGRPLRGPFRIDFVCYSEIVVEAKARAAIGPPDQAQVINYLAATDLRVALLLNFGGSQLEYRRLVLG
ncbi:MAG: GxxExxY protein [Acidobacteria bacterium]|nr:GxxExxY protein [Acidobacteriota bacterium]